MQYLTEGTGAHATLVPVHRDSEGQMEHTCRPPYIATCAACVFEEEAENAPVEPEAPWDTLEEKAGLK
jgi:hypothetical protein